MQVPDSEDLANHVGPESCVAHREVRLEALTAERIGQLLNHDRLLIPGADTFRTVEGSTFWRAIASARTTRRGRRPWHVRTLFAREPGDPTSDQRRVAGLVRIGKARSRSR